MIGRVCRMMAVLVVAVVSLGTTGASARETKSTLEFRAVLTELPPAGVTTTSLAPADRTDAAVKIATCDTAAVEQLPVVPTTTLAVANADTCVVFPQRPGRATSPRYYLGPAALSNRAVKRANAIFVSGIGWAVKLNLTKAGSAAWDQLADQQFHEQVAMTLGGIVLSAPTVQPNEVTFSSFGGTAVISGAFTQKQAKAIAAAARGANGR
jgi:preprotein translocase subunit SecD